MGCAVSHATRCETVSSPFHASIAATLFGLKASRDPHFVEKVEDVVGRHLNPNSSPVRQAFLSQPEHRIAFHFTPRHASWLNQIEIWFSILVRKLIRRGDFTSKQGLRTKIKQFIAYFNATMATPFRWTMTAKPLTA